MKKKTEIEILIQKMAFPNKGIGFVGDTKVVVKNTIIGQTVKALVCKKRSGELNARLLEVVSPSQWEQKPLCRHFSLCGGCNYQHISHETELHWKEGMVLQILQNAGIQNFQYEGIVSSPSLTEYRNKCEFSFGDECKGGALSLGMRKRQSMYEVVTVTDCNLVDQDFRTIIQAVLSFFQKREIPFYHKLRHDGVLRYLVVRKSTYTGEILINLVTTPQPPFSLKEFQSMLLSLSLQGTICGILHTAQDSLADAVIPENVSILYGKDFFTEKLCGLTFRVSMFSFFQTNSRGAEQLYQVVQEFAGDVNQKLVFDLYCGTGTIGQIMAQKAKQVIGIEIIEEAVNAAIENAAQNQLSNCTFLAGDVLKKIEELSCQPDLMILDPPREGIHKKAIEKLIAFHAPNIIYVSCKPTSLGKDLQELIQGGYEVKRVRLVDLFPRTQHIETVVLLSRKETANVK